MRKTRLQYSLLFLFVSSLTFGGGIVTNTNQSAAWVRMYARDASRDIDAVYYNPAGLSSLGKGFFFSVNNQSLFSTRTIKNDYFALNSHTYKGELSAPLFPGIYGAYSTGKWIFSIGFNPVGGGGKAVYDKGLPSFELAIADLKPGLAARGVTDYSSNVYFKGTSVFYGFQGGVTYKINDMVSVYAGGRYVYVVNKYAGYLRSNTVYFGTTPMPATTFFTNAAQQASAGAASVQPLISNGGGALTLPQAESAGYITTAQRTQLEAGLTSMGVNPSGFTVQQVQGAYLSAANNYNAKANLLRDQEADVTQSGSGFAPIVGVNFSLLDNKLDVGVKYEFKANIDLTNKTNKDITTGYTTSGDSITQFPNGQKTPSDMPALFTFGASYKLIKNFRLSGGFHYYFDKDANYGRSKNGIVVENKELINSNNYELAVGLEYNITGDILVSAGYLFTKTGVMVGYNTDLSYSLGSNSVGFGGRVAISPVFDIDLGFSYTKYIPDSKTYTHVIPTTPAQSVSLKEEYDKDVLIFAVGLNIKLAK